MASHTPAQQNQTIDVAIIGGGASGMVAALEAKRVLLEQNNSSASVVIFERNDRMGKKLLTTGNGRCNLSNLDCSIDHFHGNDAQSIAPVLAIFTPHKVRALFEEIGLVCTVDEENRIYPASLHASSVLDTLRLALDEAAVTVNTGTKVSSVTHSGNVFELRTSDGALFTARTVIVATGGACAPGTGSDGNGYALLRSFSHTLIPPIPSIVQLTTDISFVKPLSGNKIRGTATLRSGGQPVRTESGEILFTDYGLSGPPILQLSGYVSRALHSAKGSTPPALQVEIDFLPNYTYDSLLQLFEHRRNAYAARCLEEFLTGIFHRRLAYGILKVAIGMSLSLSVSELTFDNCAAIARTCKECRINVTGTQSFAHAQTTAGGIPVSEFDLATMQSRLCKGLFASGEVLDIDGDCGGYNLHWAWASGCIAGAAAANFCCGEHS